VVLLELFENLLAESLSHRIAQVVGTCIDTDALIHCIDAEMLFLLNSIKSTIEDAELNDFLCIEQIVSLLEDHGVAIKSRHEFI